MPKPIRTRGYAKTARWGKPLPDRFRIIRDRRAPADQQFILQVDKNYSVVGAAEDWQDMGRAAKKGPLAKVARYAANPRITKPIRGRSRDASAAAKLQKKES